MNHVAGPDGIPGNCDPGDPCDDDDPTDPFRTKPQRETTLAIIRSLEEPQIFGAWIDRSWYDDYPAPYSNDVTIGFGVSRGIGCGRDPSDPNDRCWNFMHDLARSRDGYSAPGHLPPPVGENDPNRWFEAQGNPVVAVVTPESADSGVIGVHLVGAEEGIVEGQTARRIFYAWSPDGRTDWDVRTVVYTPDISQADYWDEMPYISVWGSEPGRGAKYVFVTWTRQETAIAFWPKNILYSVSSNGGLSFSAPMRLSDPDPPAELADALYSTSTFGPAGDLYVVWHQAPVIDGGQDINHYIKYRKSNDFGDNWYPGLNSNGQEIVSFTPSALVWDFGHVNFEVADRPAMVVGRSCGRRGWLYVCYASMVERPQNNRQADIFVVRSRDGGVTWDEPVRVNDDDVIYDPDNVPIPTVQVSPWIAQDDLGHIGVGFYDRRNDTPDDDDPNNWNRLQHYYFAYSSDGGTSFWDNVRVTDPNKPSDTIPRFSPPRPVELGLYTQLGAAHSSFFALWCDARNWGRETVERFGDIYYSEIRIMEGMAPDGDGDCDVDLDDFSLFAVCYNGAATPVPRQCWAWDFDADGDVDLDDLSVFAACYTAAGAGCEWQEGGAQSAAPGGAFDLGLLADPVIADLYRRLYEYCREHGIPFP